MSTGRENGKAYITGAGIGKWRRGNKPLSSATSSCDMDLHSGKVVMNDDKLVLYESLIRASLVLIFSVALIVGALGLVVISQTFMRQAVTNSQFLSQSITSE